MRLVRENGRENGGVFTSKIVQVPDVFDARENVKIKGGSKRLKKISRAFWGCFFIYTKGGAFIFTFSHAAHSAHSDRY